MNSAGYRTISKPSEGQFKVRGSKFLAFAYHVSDADTIKTFIQTLKDEHPTARHVCYAYILGDAASDFRANDDGEPNGSAGLPILNQIRSKELSYTLVAVVRYFGGTKLGVPGLVNAYKAAAKDALENAEIVERQPMKHLKMTFPIALVGDVERTIRQANCNVVSQTFGAECVWVIEFPTSSSAIIEAKFTGMMGLTFG